jgi:hypothetical protein
MRHHQARRERREIVDLWYVEYGYVHSLVSEDYTPIPNQEGKKDNTHRNVWTDDPSDELRLSESCLHELMDGGKYHC